MVNYLEKILQKDAPGRKTTLRHLYGPTGIFLLRIWHVRDKFPPGFYDICRIGDINYTLLLSIKLWLDLLKTLPLIAAKYFVTQMPLIRYGQLLVLAAYNKPRLVRFLLMCGADPNTRMNSIIYMENSPVCRNFPLTVESQYEFVARDLVAHGLHPQPVDMFHFSVSHIRFLIGANFSPTWSSWWVDTTRDKFELLLASGLNVNALDGPTFRFEDVLTYLLLRKSWLVDLIAVYADLSLTQKYYRPHIRKNVTNLLPTLAPETVATFEALEWFNGE